MWIGIYNFGSNIVNNIGEYLPTYNITIKKENALERIGYNSVSNEYDIYYDDLKLLEDLSINIGKELSNQCKQMDVITKLNDNTNNNINKNLKITSLMNYCYY